ncbi:cytochrome P450 [Microvirga sp. G4-2]|uniref:cytochrome P450 n=1 Tax=Microvirga sp. G4-2 TaxID=3434467 RepID=UPI0040446A33
MGPDRHHDSGRTRNHGGGIVLVGVPLGPALPEVQEQVAQEAASALPDGGAEPPLSRLPYTRAVLDEVMRLYPPAYVIVRTARRTRSRVSR